MGWGMAMQIGIPFISKTNFIKTTKSSAASNTLITKTVRAYDAVV